jgi:hypothetical protein
MKVLALVLAFKAGLSVLCPETSIPSLEEDLPLHINSDKPLPKVKKVLPELSRPLTEIKGMVFRCDFDISR